MSRQTRYSPEVRERAVRMVLEHQDEHLSQWAVVGLLLVLILWAVYPSLNAYYTADDVFFIESLTTQHMKASWVGNWGVRNSFRPLTIFSFWLDGQIWGRNPLGFRLTNLGLHLLCSALLVGILQRFWKDRTALMMSAGYFLLSFTHHENLFWISARTNLLGTVFELLAVFCLVQIRPSRWRVLAVVAAFAASLLCYENALTFPMLLSVLYLGWLRPLGAQRDRGPASVSLSLLLAIWVTWAGYLAWRFVALRGIGHTERTATSVVDMTGNFVQSLLASFSILVVGGVEYNQSSLVLLGLSAALQLVPALFLLIVTRGQGRSKGLAAAVIWVLAMLPFLTIAHFEARFVYGSSAVSAATMAWIWSRPNRLGSLPLRRLGVVCCVVALLANAMLLRAVSHQWHQAGEITRQYSALVEEHDEEICASGSVVFLNIPQSVGLAHAFLSNFQIRTLVHSRLNCPDAKVSVLGGDCDISACREEPCFVWRQAEQRAVRCLQDTNG